MLTAGTPARVVDARRPSRSGIAERRRFFAGVALLAALTAVAGLAASARSAGKTKEIPYAGQFVADPTASVFFDVRRKRGENVRAIFHVENVAEQCDDGTTNPYTTVPFGFRFVRANAFRGEIVTDNPYSGTTGVFKVKGRLPDPSRAQGWIYSNTDRADPPPEGFPDLPDCTTGGKLRWEAQRRPPGDSDY